MISFSVKAPTRSPKKTVFFSDGHYPSVDQTHYASLLQFLKDEKPDVVVNGGDWWDMKFASRFVEATLGKALVDGHRIVLARLIEKIQAEIVKIPQSEFTRERVLDSTIGVLTDETQIDIAGQLRAGMRELNRVTEVLKPNAIQVLIKGNHEHRIYSQLDKIRHIVGPDYDPLKDAIRNLALKPWRLCNNYPNGNYAISLDPTILFQHGGKGFGITAPKNTWRHNRDLGASIIYGDWHKTGGYYGPMEQSQLKDERFSIGIGTFGDKWDEDTFGYATIQARATWDCSFLVVTEKPGRISFDVIQLEDSRPCPLISHYETITPNA